MRIRLGRPSHATVVAYLALFVALGGTSMAATGGTFVLGPGDRVRYEWRDRYAGDGADLDAVVAAIPTTAAVR